MTYSYNIHNCLIGQDMKYNEKILVDLYNEYEKCLGVFDAIITSNQRRELRDDTRNGNFGEFYLDYIKPLTYYRELYSICKEILEIRKGENIIKKLGTYKEYEERFCSFFPDAINDLKKGSRAI